MKIRLCINVFVCCLIWTVSTAAPTEERGPHEESYNSPYLRHEAPIARGCMYQSQRYEHGEEVKTAQPCLNCTCSRGILLCFLRVCPLVTAPSQGCFTARKEGECCPSVVCSSSKPDGVDTQVTSEGPLEITTVPYYEDETFNEDLFPEDTYLGSEKDGTNSKDTNQIENSQEKTPVVSTTAPSADRPLMLVTSTTPKPWLFDDLDPNDISYLNTIQGGCFLNGSLYAEGSAVLPRSFCEYCYCIRGKEMCIQPKCHLAIDGCSPHYSSEYSCCPTSYICALKNYTADAITAMLGTTTPATATTSASIASTTETVSTSTSSETTWASSGTTWGSSETSIGLRADEPHVCEVAGLWYTEGDAVPGGGHCQSCFCSKDGVRCQDIECSPIVDGCHPVIPEGHCCPVEYECNKTAYETESMTTESVADEPSVSTTFRSIVNETGDENIEESDEPLVVDLENKTNSYRNVPSGVYDVQESSAVESEEAPDESNSTVSSQSITTTIEAIPVTDFKSDSHLKSEARDDPVEIGDRDDSESTEQPDRTTEQQPDRTTAQQSDTTAIQQPDRTTAQQPDTTTIQQPDGTTAQQPDRTTAQQPDITTAQTTTSTDDLTTQQSFDKHFYSYSEGEVNGHHVPSWALSTAINTSENSTDMVPGETERYDAVTEVPHTNDHGKITVVLMSGNQSNTYVLSVATPDTLNRIHSGHTHESDNPDSPSEKDVSQTSTLESVTKETATENHTSDLKQSDESELGRFQTTTNGYSYKEPSSVDVQTETEISLPPPAEKTQSKTSPGRLDKEGTAAIRENDRIIYFSEPDLEENIKKILELEAHEDSKMARESTTTEEDTESTTMDYSDESTQYSLVTEENLSESVTKERLTTDKGELHSEKPLIRASPDGAVINVYYPGDQDTTTTNIPFDQKEPEVSKTETQMIKKPVFIEARVPPEPLKPTSSSNVLPHETAGTSAQSTEPEITMDPWALYYRGPTSSFNTYSIPGEVNPSPYLYIPGEGTYYKFQADGSSPGSQLRSPIFSRPEHSVVASVGGPRNNPDNSSPQNVEIITAPTPPEAAENLDFGRHHLYKQDSKQSRADSDTKVVSLKQIFQVSSSNAGKAAPKNTVLTVRFASDQDNSHQQQREGPHPPSFSEPKTEGFVPLKHHPTTVIGKRQDTLSIPEEPKEPKPHMVIPFLAEDAVGSSSKSNHSVFVGPYRLKTKSTPKPEDLQSGSCLSGGRYFVNGDMIYKSDPCQLCRCFYGRELCQEQRCPEIPNRDCIAEKLPGYCCPRITCGTSDSSLENPTTVTTKSQPLQAQEVPINSSFPSGGWKISSGDSLVSTTSVPSVNDDGITPDSQKDDDPDHNEKQELNTSPFEFMPISMVSTESYNAEPSRTVTTEEVSSTKPSTLPTTSTTTTSTTTTSTPRPKLSVGVTNPPLKENSLWGLLKVSGCNIYGRFYKIDEQVTELSGQCNSCVCSVKGVDCKQLC